jgi:signal transduction histidine kinase
MKIIKKLPYSLALILLLFLQSCEKRKEVINNTNYNSKQVDKYFKLADKFYDDSEYDSAFYYANKTKLIINPKRDSKKYTITMFILITSQQLQGDYSGAESTIVETLSFVDKSNNDKYKWKFYGMLANNYTHLNNYDDAIYYYKKASSFNVDKKRKLSEILNIGYIYNLQKQFKKALEILEPLLKEQEITTNKHYYSTLLNNLGYCYFKINNKNAINYLNQSLEMNSNMDSTVDDDYGLTANYYYLYEYYLKYNKNKAIKYADLLYQKASEYKNPDDQLLALSLLIKHSSGKELKRYSLNYIHVNDSITKVRQKAKNYFAKLKYDSKKEKEENEILKTQRALEQEQQKNKNLLFYFIISIGLIATLFIYYYLITKNKKEKIKVSYNTEVRIAKKLHDELANDVYHTMAFAETQDLSTNSNKEKLLHNLDTIYTRTRNISKENSAINTDILFVPNLKEMMLGFSTEKINILTNGMETIHWEKIETFKKITAYRVLQELLVNMKKHSNCSLVILMFKENENQLEINYTDNGIGVTEEQLKSKSGLKNVENRMLAIKGSISFNTTSETGFKVNISLPI